MIRRPARDLSNISALTRVDARDASRASFRNSNIDFSYKKCSAVGPQVPDFLR